MSLVLIVDGDARDLETTAEWLRSNGYELAAASSGRMALYQAEQRRPDVALIALALPDTSGLDVIRRMRAIHPETAFVLVARAGTYEIACEAVRLGVTALATKPLVLSGLGEVIERARGRSPRESVIADSGLAGGLSGQCVAHSLRRWASVVTCAIDAKEDFRTLGEWGRAIGVSTGALRNWCYTANIPARASLRFARVLRAVFLQRDLSVPPEDLLNVVDRRTIAKLMRLSGGLNRKLPRTTAEFLERQQLIQNTKAVEEVRCVLASRVASVECGTRGDTLTASV